MRPVMKQPQKKIGQDRLHEILQLQRVFAALSAEPVNSSTSLGFAQDGFAGITQAPDWMFFPRFHPDLFQPSRWLRCSVSRSFTDRLEAGY